MEKREEKDLYATVILTPHFEESAEEEESLEDDESSSIYQEQESSSDKQSKEETMKHAMLLIRATIDLDKGYYRDKHNISTRRLIEIYRQVFTDTEEKSRSFIWSSTSGLNPIEFRISNNAYVLKRDVMKRYGFTSEDVKYLALHAYDFGGWF